MSSLSKFWRLPALIVALALPLAVACADDEGATPPGQDPTPTTGTISGTVTNAADGSPIVGALVGTSPATTTALTDAQGNYSITNVPIPSSGSASFAVTASKEGFNSASTSVTLSESSPTATANLQLVKPAGPVDPTQGDLNVLVTNRNGEAQSDADVTVRDASGAEVASASTDANGFALFSDLDAGSYTVVANKTISGIAFTAAAGVNVEAGETAFVQLSLRRDFDQTVFPNIDGESVTLGDGSDIRFVQIPGGDSNPEVDCNIIRTQHMYVVEVVNEDGDPVSGVKVEWDLNISENGTVSLECPEILEFFDDEAGCTVPTVPGDTGSIVDTDDPDLDPATARSGMSPAFKVDSRNAVTFTNDGPQTVSFGPSNVTVDTGQSWIVITSPVEGITNVIASSPDIPRSNPECANNEQDACDKEFAIKRWVNWDISVHEVMLEGNEENIDEETYWPDPAELEADEIPVNEIDDGDLVINILDREELTETENSDGEDPGCNADSPDDVDAGDFEYCELTDNQADFQVRIERLRGDSPFNMSRGVVVMSVTDDSPDVDFWGEGVDNGDTSDPFETSGCEEESDHPREGSPTNDVCNTELNGLTDDEFWVGPAPGYPTTRNQAVGQFDANNNVFDGGIAGIIEDEDDFIGWVHFQVRLNPSTYYCEDGTDGGPTDFDCQPNEDGNDAFSEEYQRLLAGTVDNTNTFEIEILDEFGEVCGTFTFDKRWVTSRLEIIKTTPDARRRTVHEDDDGPEIAEGNGSDAPRSVKTHTVEVGQTFSYTITVINDGDVRSENVRITDTLPRFSYQFCNAATPGESDCDNFDMRQGHQAFVFERDRPAFDPHAIVYAIDTDNDENGDEIDYCIVGRDGALGGSYVAPLPCHLAPSPIVEAGSVDDARDEAIDASGDGDQVVWIQWFDQEVLARTEVGGGVQSEDSVEVFLFADSELYNAADADEEDEFDDHNDIPGTWCNIATVTDGPNNEGTEGDDATSTDAEDLRIQSFDADTLCHEVVEGLLDIRKTVEDAVIVAGSNAIWTVEVENGGSATLNDVVIADTVDQDLLARDLEEGDIVVDEDNFPGATVTITGSNTFEVALGDLDPTGFIEAYTVSVPTVGQDGTFCNRVTVTGETGAGDELTETDISCVTLSVSIEMDVSNEDGFIDDGGQFVSDKEIFVVGESGDDFVYRIQVTNQSTFTATNVEVEDEVAPNSGIFIFEAIIGTPTHGTVSGESDSGFFWDIGDLGPGEVAQLDFSAIAERTGNDVNRVKLTADQLTGVQTDEEPTTISE